jgi:hypothetical protein
LTDEILYDMPEVISRHTALLYGRRRSAFI